MPGEMESNWALTDARDDPGFIRASITSHHIVPLASHLFSLCRAGAAQRGTAKSYDCPTSIPKKVAGVMPTISTAWELSDTVPPTAVGLPPSSRCQNA